jgi:hypothetical protein
LSALDERTEDWSFAHLLLLLQRPLVLVARRSPPPPASYEFSCFRINKLRFIVKFLNFDIKTASKEKESTVSLDPFVSPRGIRNCSPREKTVNFEELGAFKIICISPYLFFYKQILA